MRIVNSADFLAHVKEGDTVYRLTTNWLVPEAIVEHKIVSRKIEVVRGVWREQPSVLYKYITPSHPYSPLWAFLDDSLNEHHGMWTNLDEALAYFRERRLQYDMDPEWQERSRRKRAQYEAYKPEF